MKIVCHIQLSNEINQYVDFSKLPNRQLNVLYQLSHCLADQVSNEPHQIVNRTRAIQVRANSGLLHPPYFFGSVQAKLLHFSSAKCFTKS